MKIGVNFPLLESDLAAYQNGCQIFELCIMTRVFVAVLGALFSTLDSFGVKRCEPAVFSLILRNIIKCVRIQGVIFGKF